MLKNIKKPFARLSRDITNRRDLAAPSALRKVIFYLFIFFVFLFDLRVNATATSDVGSLRLRVSTRRRPYNNIRAYSVIAYYYNNALAHIWLCNIIRRYYCYVMLSHSIHNHYSPLSSVTVCSVCV